VTSGRRILILALCLWCLGGELPGADWPQFRGPDGSGFSTETGLPASFGPKENLRWRVDLPGRGVSNPVVARGNVFVTCSSGPRQERLHVLCFDVATGRKKWERQIRATADTRCNPKTCMAGPTPATDGERVYALFATADLACLDADGNLLWYRALAQDYPTIGNQVGMAASPILFRNVLLVPMENVGESFVCGLDKQTGRNLWKHPRRRDINWVSPVLLQDGTRTEVLFQSADELTAYDPETGEKHWSYRAPGLSTIPSPAVDQGTVLVPGGELLAVKPAAGKEAPEVLWKSSKLKSSLASVLSYRGRVYAVNSANVLNCADAADGKVLWRQRLEGFKGEISASPVAADGKVYVVNEDGLVAVVKVTADTPEMLAVNNLNETILATPAIADRAIFLRSDAHLWCFSEKK
jgi:outer membrane protein assembly factor BamB